METLPQHWILAILAVFAIQWVKDSKLPVFNNGSGTPNAILSALVAAATATGISFAQSWDAVAGTYSFTVTGLTASSVLPGLWAWAQQFGWQWITWKLVKGKV